VLLKVTTLLLSYVTQGCPAFALKVRGTGAQNRQQQLLSGCSLHGADLQQLIPQGCDRMYVNICATQEPGSTAPHQAAVECYSLCQYLSLSVFSRDSQGVERGAAAVTDLQSKGRGPSHLNTATLLCMINQNCKLYAECIGRSCSHTKRRC